MRDVCSMRLWRSHSSSRSRVPRSHNMHITATRDVLPSLSQLGYHDPDNDPMGRLYITPKKGRAPLPTPGRAA